jgi:predicted secreted protein
MDNDPTLSEVVKKTKVGRTRRLVFMLATVLVLAVLTGVVVAGFRGRHISQNAAALTAPGASPAKGGWRPWWLQ